MASTNPIEIRTYYRVEYRANDPHDQSEIAQAVAGRFNHLDDVTNYIEFVTGKARDELSVYYSEKHDSKNPWVLTIIDPAKGTFNVFAHTEELEVIDFDALDDDFDE